MFLHFQLQLLINHILRFTQSFGYAILVQKGSKIAMENVCFTNNVFLGYGPVVFNGTNVSKIENINSEENSTDIHCSFAFNISSQECIAPNGTECTPTTPDVPIASSSFQTKFFVLNVVVVGAFVHALFNLLL